MKISAVSAAKVHLWNSGDGTAVFLLRTCDQSTVNDDSADFTGGYFKQSDRQPQSCRPVKKLSDEVEEAQKNNSTSLRFSDTGIRELDQFAGAITQMN